LHTFLLIVLKRLIQLFLESEELRARHIVIL
jgi:hypothetical protein